VMRYSSGSGVECGGSASASYSRVSRPRRADIKAEALPPHSIPARRPSILFLWVPRSSSVPRGPDGRSRIAVASIRSFLFPDFRSPPPILLRREIGPAGTRAFHHLIL
jgi:hypothetical protein